MLVDVNSRSFLPDSSNDSVSCDVRTPLKTMSAALRAGITKALDIKALRSLSIGIVVTVFSSTAMAEVYFQDSTVELSGNGPRSSRDCQILFTPAMTFGDQAPRLIVKTTGPSRFSVGVENAERYQAAVIVQDNMRRPFLSIEDAERERFRTAETAKVLKSERLFFVTARHRTTLQFVSSRFDQIKFDAILEKVEQHCRFDAESFMSDTSSRQAAERALIESVPPGDMKFIRWALNKRYELSSSEPGRSPFLSAAERGYLKRYAAENGLPITQYLTVDMYRRLKPEGVAIERASVPPVIVVAPPAFPPGTPGFWDHNGSVLGMVATGPKRVFRLQLPRKELRDLGVREGSLFFEGTRAGQTYQGTAYVFSKSCGASGYAVTGQVSDDDRVVTLFGRAPIRDGSCRIASYRDDVLRLIFHDHVDNWGRPR